MLIDTHSHLNFNAFRDDLDEVIKRSLAEDVFVINIGTKYETSKKAVEIAERYKEGVFAAIGLHPIHLATDLVKIKTDPEEGAFEAKGEDFDKEKYKKLALSKVEGSKKPSTRAKLSAGLSRTELRSGSGVVAIGEIGLDYYYRPKTKKKLELFKEKQRTVLCWQLDLARELNLPVIFHCRMAHEDLIKILEEQRTKNNEQLNGVIHCFTGGWQQAEKYLEMGLYLGFNGIIYKLDLNEVIKKTPLERILVETDCPYLTPPLPSEALAKDGRNEPIFVKYIAKDIAKIKNLDYQRVAEITTQNAKNLFGI